MKRYGYLTGAALGLTLACTSAHAELKDPLPDSLSLGGITLYGTVDIGYAYQSARRTPEQPVRWGARVSGFHDNAKFRRLGVNGR